MKEEPPQQLQEVVVSLSGGGESVEVLPQRGQDNTPSLIEQAEAKGWRAGMFNFGKAEDSMVARFNSGLIEREDGLWLIARQAVFDGTDAFGVNSLWAFHLKDDDSLMPEFGKRLDFPDTHTGEHFEDPRCVYHRGHAWIGTCNFIWSGNGEWTGAHQTLGVFKTEIGGNDDWLCIRRYAPEVGGNSKHVDQKGRLHEKNWLWWFHDDRLALLYHSNPWRVVQFGQKWEDVEKHELDFGVSWKYGDIRGGTPPVLVDDLYWTFFHSSVGWVGRFRRYHMGAIAFESKPPFKPVSITSEPLLSGSQKDRWGPRKPLVVFPCGSRIKDGEWLITYGINDLATGWVKIPHKDVKRLVQPLSEAKAIVEKEPELPTELPREIVNSKEMLIQKEDFPPSTATVAATVAAAAEFESLESLSLGDEIRGICDRLLQLENGQPSRHQRILTELRKRHLVPRARKR